MKIGIIGSSGGSVVRELLQGAKSGNDYWVVTDRSCGLESLANDFSLAHMRFDGVNNDAFSLQATEFFKMQGGVDFVILFYSRLVTPQLYDIYPTFNLHPSLLPDYQGFNAVERAYNDSISLLGATLHLVDSRVDAGPIVAQVKTHIKIGIDLSTMHRISFAQKTYLALYLIDLIESEGIKKITSGFQDLVSVMNPTLKSKNYREFYDQFLTREKLSQLV